MAVIPQELKYEAERDRDFANEIMATPGCDKLSHCIQCGTCSGTCPLSIFMDYTPRRIINLTRAGFKEEVLKSRTIWLCASCYSCTVQCPKEIKITDIMYALKQRAIRERSYPRRFPIPVLARGFFLMVKMFGRVNESILAAFMFAQTRWWELFKMSGLGLKLIARGRFSFLPERMRNRRELRTLLKGFREDKP